MAKMCFGVFYRLNSKKQPNWLIVATQLILMHKVTANEIFDCEMITKHAPCVDDCIRNTKFEHDSNLGKYGRIRLKLIKN